MTEDKKGWLWQEVTDLVRTSASMLTAITVIATTTATVWVWLGAPIPISVRQHAIDLQVISGKIDKFFDQVTRNYRNTRIEVLENKLQVMDLEFTNNDDAMAIHRRAIQNNDYPEAEKLLADGRVRVLSHKQETLKRQMDEVRREIIDLRRAARTNAPIDNEDDDQ